MPGGYVCSASLKGTLPAEAVLAIGVGRKGTEHDVLHGAAGVLLGARARGLAIDDLSVLGPIFVLKLKLPKKTFSRRIVVEMWLYPDGSRILELSTKALPSEALNVAIEVREFLAERGVEMSGQQQTKTKAALEFFSAELTAERQRD